MGGRTVIGDPGGGGGAAPVTVAAGSVAATLAPLRQIVIAGMVARGYPEVGRLDLEGMPQTVPLLLPEVALVWALMPAAMTEFGGLTILRQRADLSGASEARLVVNVSAGGAAAAKLRAQYSTDLAAWSYLDGASGPSVPVAASGIAASAWVTLEAAAAADVWLRLVGIDGDGVASPSFGSVSLQVR